MTMTEFSAKLIVGDVAVELDAEDLRLVAGSLIDKKSNIDVFRALATSPSYRVRSQVAGMHNLDHETVDLLARDSVMEVLKRLIRSGAAQSYLSEETIFCFVDGDAHLAAEIARNFERFERVDTQRLAELLSNHSDPSVRRRLTTNRATPESVLGALASDIDPGVARAALDEIFRLGESYCQHADADPERVNMFAKLRSLIESTRGGGS